MYESIHAYLVTYFASDPLIATIVYSDMVDAFGKTPDLNQVHHNEYVNAKYVSSIASSLQLYGQSKGYNLNYDYYYKLAWGGLEGTNAFKALTISTQTAIRDVILTEFVGIKADGTPTTQAGVKAGCK